MKCCRCGRYLKHPSASGYGPVCERAVIGPRPRKRAQRLRAVDDKQQELPL